MTKEQQQEKIIQEAQEALAKALSGLEDIKKAKASGKRWKPAEGENYWVVQFDTGCVFTSQWDNHRYDEARYNLGNLHQTKELAQKALDKQLAYVKITDFIAEKNAEQGWVADWSDNGQNKFALSWVHTQKNWILAPYVRHQSVPTELLGPSETMDQLSRDLSKELKTYLEVGD